MNMAMVKNGVCSALSAGVLGGLLCGCTTPREVGDAQYLTAMERGGKAYAARRDGSAADEYETAFLRALATDQPLAAGDAAYNLALIDARRGEYEKALLVLNTGMESVRCSGGAVPWDMYLLKAKILASLQRNPEALEAVQLASAASGAQNAPTAREQIDLFTAQIQWKLGNTVESARLLGEMMKRSLSPGSEAGCLMLRSEMGAAQGLYGDAAGDMNSAVPLLQAAGDYAGMADAMLMAADTFAKANQWNEAGARYLDAASAFFGQRRNVDALKAIELALQSSSTGGAAEQRIQALNLVELIKRQMPETTEEQQ